MQRARSFRRLTVRLNTDDLYDALASLGPAGAGVFVHSSLSACGYVIGGAPTVIDALTRWAGDGLLVLPTHTYCYPEGLEPAPVFDAGMTESCVGVVTDQFWRLPDVVRSRHPSHSLAARGPGDRALCAEHELCATPCGRGTPYERLVAMDCSVLMFGATMNTYTLFHTAEDEVDVPYLYDAATCELRFADGAGRTRSVASRRQDMRVARRFVLMAEWLEERRLLVRKRLGVGELLFMPHSAAVHEAVVGELRQDPYFLVAAASRPAAERVR